MNDGCDIAKRLVDAAVKIRVYRRFAIWTSRMSAVQARRVRGMSLVARSRLGAAWTKPAPAELE